MTFLFDILSSIYFGVELFTRFICCPSQLIFMKDTFNVVDLLGMVQK